MTCKELAEKLMKTPELPVVTYNAQYDSAGMLVTSVYKHCIDNPNQCGPIIDPVIVIR